MEIRGWPHDKESEDKPRGRENRPRERTERKTMRYDHYQRVVQWDLRQKFPQRTSAQEVPKVKKVTRMWSLIGLGFQPKWIPAAWTALDLMTGQKPKRVYTTKSVAQRRLKEGDPVGCRVTVTGKSAYERREQWTRRIYPEVRPFHGFPRQVEAEAGKVKAGRVDQGGQRTFHMEQPGVIPARAPYYEAYFQLVVGSSGTHAGGRYRTVETSAKNPEEAVALMQGRRFPRVTK
jgi:ribosomal protein L5